MGLFGRRLSKRIGLIFAGKAIEGQIDITPEVSALGNVIFNKQQHQKHELTESRKKMLTPFGSGRYISTCYYIPALKKRGVYCFNSVCPSVCPSVCASIRNKYFLSHFSQQPCITATSNLAWCFDLPNSGLPLFFFPFYFPT